MSSQPSWPPFQPTKDCSLGICSIYCPRWCYSLFPPPPPFFETDDEDSSPSLSPLAIALIALAATTLILVGYYTVIYRFCRRWHHPSTTTTTTTTATIDDETPTAEWQGSPHGGLDDALINKITICRYKKADGLVGGAANCSVCLSEFREDEGLRLLPKCSHAFHVQCIDTWLKSHPNCPLCRAGIVWTSPPEVPMAPSSSERNRSGHQMNDLEIIVQDSGSDEQIQKDPAPDASENSTGSGGGEGSQLSGSPGSSMSGGGSDQSQPGRSGVLSV